MLNSTKMHKYLSRHGILRHKTHTETLTDTQKYRHVRIHRDTKKIEDKKKEHTCTHTPGEICPTILIQRCEDK